MKRILAIGLSGQVGEALWPRLSSFGEICALSRQQQVDAPGLHWLSGSLQNMPALPTDIDTILSLGPLDAFVEWFAQSGLRQLRVVALGSMGREDKRDASDPEEKRIARALAHAETRLFEAGRQQAAAITLLRPTLIYGSRGNSGLAPMLAMARRWGFVCVPMGALGLRQPVHVDDVAGALLACLDVPATYGQAYDLPGGERMSFHEMIKRSLARQAPKARIVILPGGLFRAGLGLLSSFGYQRVSAGFVERSGRDQVADGGAARAAFGFRPRSFDP